MCSGQCLFTILKTVSLLFVIALVFVACAPKKSKKSQAANEDLLQYVNPFIGTEKMGHTYPGATVPFGKVQLSPSTDSIGFYLDGKYNPRVYDYCAAYRYEDNTITGFSHTHFSGTGHSDLGDFLVMPTVGEVKLNPGTADNPDAGYRSRFSHQQEWAEPAYYKVLLQDYQVMAELTASNRVGFHRYTFPKTNQANIILDLNAGIYSFDEKNVWSFVRVENDTLITGFRQTSGWARTRFVYFAASFSKPIKEYGFQICSNQPYNGFWRKFDQSHNFPEAAARSLKAWFRFETEDQEAVQIKFAISPVSSMGALANMKQEIPHWDFDVVRSQGRRLWAEELNKIRIEADAETMANFYTSMYHACLAPTVYMDVDGQYRGLDMNNHAAQGFTNYSTFSLWDTFRALHPLLNLIQPERNRDMVLSMLAHYDQSVHKMLPVWSHQANENWCMIGYHSVAVVADAIMKDIKGFDYKQALDACVATACNPYYDGLQYYMELGYVPEDKSGSSVSKTLEYAYDDWCIAQVANKLGEKGIYDVFVKRSENWKNVYDMESGFMRPRLSDGSFLAEFDPLDTHQKGFIEGNSWNYSLFVPHNPEGLFSLMGGKERMLAYLDSLFDFNLPDKYFEHTEDITREGIIGNYVHGNEPSHHVAYLYHFTSSPRKTQERIRQIMDTMYKPRPDGLCGNDDCGQMSAWYIFNALGFYPMAPGSDKYYFGLPIVEKAVISLPGEKQLSIETHHPKSGSSFVERIELNGKPVQTPYITHSEVLNGGKLDYYFGK